MTREEVAALFGTPGKRSFNGNQSAWQYCETGLFSDTYITVWFLDDKVQALSNYNNTADGLCTSYFRPVNWVESPNVNVNVNIDNSKSK